MRNSSRRRWRASGWNSPFVPQGTCRLHFGHSAAHIACQDLQSFAMKIPLILLVLSVAAVSACNKSTAPSASPESSTPSVSKPHDGVQQKLAEYAGASAADCGRLDVRANEAQTKSAGVCAMQASQGKKPVYVAYDMPGMSVGVAGNAEVSLFHVSYISGADTYCACATLH